MSMLTKDEIQAINQNRTLAIQAVSNLNLGSVRTESETEEKEEKEVPVFHIVERIFPSLTHPLQEPRMRSDLDCFWDLSPFLTSDQLVLVYEAIKDHIPLRFQFSKDIEQAFLHFPLDLAKILLETESSNFTLNDFLQLLSDPNSSYRSEVLQAIKKRTLDIKPTKEDFWKILGCLHESEKEIILEALFATEDKKAVIELLRFGYLLHKPLQRIESLMEAIKNNLSTCILSLDDFDEIFQSLEPEHHSNFFDALKDTLRALLSKPWDFMTIIGIISYKVQVSEESKVTLSSLFLEYLLSLDNQKDLKDLLTSCAKHPSLIAKAIQEKITRDKILQLLTRPYELLLVLQYLQPEDCMLLCKAVKESNPDILTASPGNSMLDRVGDGIQIIQQFTPEKYRAIFGTLPAFFQNAGTFSSMLRLCPEGLHETVYEVGLPILPELMSLNTSNCYDFIYIFQELKPEKRPAFYESVKNCLPQLIHTADELADLLASLDPMPGDACTILQNKFLELVHSGKDLRKILNQLNTDQCAYLWGSIKTLLSQLNLPLAEVGPFFRLVVYGRNERISLREEIKEPLYRAIVEVFSRDITCVQDFIRLCSGFHEPKEHEDFYASSLESLLPLINTVDDFVRLMSFIKDLKLAPGAEDRVFDGVKNRLVALIKLDPQREGIDEVIRIFSILTVSQAQELCPSMKSTIKQLAPSPSAFAQFLNQLPKSHRGVVYRGEDEASLLNMSKAEVAMEGSIHYLHDQYMAVSETSAEKQEKLLQSKRRLEWSLFLAWKDESKLPKLKEEFDALAKATNEHRSTFEIRGYRLFAFGNTRSCNQLINSVSTMPKEYLHTLNAALGLNLREDHLSPATMNQALLAYVKILCQPPTEAGDEKLGPLLP